MMWFQRLVVGLMIGCGLVCLALPARPAIAQGGTLTYGDKVSGRLAGTGGDRWTFTGQAGDWVFATMYSEAFDTYLALLDEDDNELITDDDGGGDSAAYIDGYVLPWDGQYTLVARGHEDNAVGRYSLLLDSAGHLAQPIAPGDEIKGKLENAIPACYVFSATEGDRVYAAMYSEAFNSYLVLRDAEGNELVSDDDSAGDWNVFIHGFTVPWDGQFTLIARGYYPFETGRYTLSFDLLSNRVQGIAFGSVVKGDLQAPFPDIYTFSGTAGDWVYIAMLTDTFDSYLILLDQEGNELRADDDTAGSKNGYIYRYPLPSDGVYTVIARGYYFDASGPYTLLLDARSRRVQSLNPRAAIKGELVSPLPNLYTFSGTEGQTVTVTLNSLFFDAYLQIVDETSRELVSDDNSGGGTNAAINAYVLPADGEYTLVARGYNYTDSGPYELSFQLAP